MADKGEALAEACVWMMGQLWDEQGEDSEMVQWEKDSSHKGVQGYSCKGESMGRYENEPVLVDTDPQAAEVVTHGMDGGK